MTVETLLPFMAIIALGTYVQTVTGFALGMIVLGGVTGFGLAPVAFTTVVISLVSLANGVLVLKGNLSAIDKRAVVAALAGLVPALVFGVWLLDYLSESFARTLQLLLGATIVCGGLFIMLKPEPLKQRSGAVAFSAAGAAAGVIGGLFSIAGPPLVYQFYRQPLELRTIRLCLLSIFLITSIGRTALIGLQDGLNLEIFLYTALALPVVALFTWIGKQYPPPVSELWLRRFAFALLILIGTSLLITA
ncbi:TSUP family transporter [Marinobacterium arenosum]|uniref:TSUP family transporter n=1 Tax=Marinobacterium arenosum TaxID=2862496 RepID=UPI001C963ACA|nr:TSUP family transporter [Marinobacterium arenosum]MBY4677463.1 TSUP family transporter [Marinobacterium arenosum]